MKGGGWTIGQAAILIHLGNAAIDELASNGAYDNLVALALGLDGIRQHWHLTFGQSAFENEVARLSRLTDDSIPITTPQKGVVIPFPDTQGDGT